MVADWELLDRSAYPPGRIASWLNNWPALCCLVQNAATAMHLLGPERPGPTPVTPRVGARQRGYHGDVHAWSHVKADLEMAWKALPVGSLERRAVVGKAAGLSLGHIARINNTRKADTLSAYRHGLELMATYLGWQEPEPEPEPLKTGGL